MSSIAISAGLHQIAGPSQTCSHDGGPRDGELLRRFVRDGDRAAFEEIMRRHGPMVYAACRRILGNHADADDAFQATFLVLVQRVGSIQRLDSLAAWLHRVAARVSAKGRSLAARRKSRECRSVRTECVRDKD